MEFFLRIDNIKIRMSTYLLMKIFESVPSSYDRGIRLLTQGRVDEAYDRLTSRIKKGDKVLDLGCGTGALTLRAARHGAEVKGIDISPRMLGIAQQRIKEAGLAENARLYEMGVAELGREETGSFDVVMSGLCFSELTEDEFLFTLKEVKRILKPGGLLLVADEVKPKKSHKRILNWLLGLFLRPIVFLLTRSTTRAIEDLPGKITEAGLLVESVKLNKWESFIELVGRKSKGKAE